MCINKYQRVRIRPKNEVEADQKQTRSRPEADQKQTRSRPKKKVEADQKQIDWNWNITPAKNMTIKITVVNYFNNYRLQNMYQQKVETNRDEFKLKNHKNIC